MQRLLLALLATGTAASLAAACGDSFSPEGLAGTYSLQSVNEEALPATLAELGSNKLEAMSGTLVLSDDGTYNLTTQLRTTNSESTSTDTTSDHGDWESEGTEITLMDSDGGRTMGDVGGATVMLAISQVSWLYQR